MKRIGVVGAGSWGTALAALLAEKGHEVTIWSREAEVAEAINTVHGNPYLPGAVLPETLRGDDQLARTVSGAEIVVSASPSQFVRSVMTEAAPHVASDALLVSASKGIETSTLLRMDEVMGEVFPVPVRERFVVLSGPSFAKEVVRHAPTAVVVAGTSPDAAQCAQQAFQTSWFRVYTSSDVIGVELGGALKNVIALASGITAGLGYGHNTAAAVMTRGLAEITRLGVAMGADRATFSGLAGMGDLVLTCTGSLSRNRTVGERLGRGESLDGILSDMKAVAEGVKTTESVHALAARMGVEMPIVDQVHEILYEGKSAAAALETLMTRDPKPEDWT